MTRVDNSIEIKAPKEKVFAFVSDLEARPQWLKWAKGTQITSLQRSGVGTTDREVMQVGPQKQKTEGLITDYQEGYTIARRLTKGMDLTERISVLNMGDATKVALNIEYTPPMGKLGQLMDFLFMSKLLDQLAEDSLTILKERMEAR
ncbi:MAG TPA: SRPBCC family protein [Dehalococcoidia bacterium]|nr:SRPBCC family protein [Dehalococcoidia bacterium]